MKNGIVDFKKSGISQDLKELKRDKDSNKREISKIRAEGKAREKRYEDNYKYKTDYRKAVFRDAEKKTITNKKDYADMKQSIKEASRINPTREKFKRNIAVGASRVETRVDVGLSNAYNKLKQVASQRVISRGVLKKNSMTVTIPDFKAPSILGDENRFFKGEMNKEKRSLFFS